MRRTLYDDNFGEWDIRHQDDLDYYYTVQQLSVIKRCATCNGHVRLLPHYAYCSPCLDKIERGEDILYYDNDEEDEDMP